MKAFQQWAGQVIVGIVVGCTAGYGSFVFAQGRFAEKLETVSVKNDTQDQRLDQLAARDGELLATIQKLDREGTQVSRQGAEQLKELKLRFDRLESQQLVAITQNARMEALLVDLKQRLGQ